MIGVIVAMDSELYKNFKTDRSCFIHVSGKQKFYIYENNDNMIALCFSGIGKVNAASAAAILIKTFNVNYIINMGSVGSCQQDIKQDDLLLIDKCYYLDVDVTAFKYELGQVPKEKPFFKTSSRLNNQLIELFNKKQIIYKLKNLGTSDSFIDRNNINKVRNKNYDLVSCFDMEATAIAQVCNKNDVNFSSIKIVSDNLNDNAISSVQFENNLLEISKKLTSILFEFIDNNILK